MDRLISLFKIAGVTLVVTSTFRSFTEQDKLYAQGRTTKGNIVTNAKGGESMHNYGVAFDIAISKNGKLDYEITPLIAFIAKFIGLEWGGNFEGFPDKPHFQLTLGYTFKDFQSGKVDWSKFN
jgi:peptidoglycan L-alanyl-D-glutamate endopeptidase CwlK